jgi:hypothetical protein
VNVDSFYDYWGWEATIREQQKWLRRLLKQSPSLKNYLADVFDEIWQDALTEVREAYPKTIFPDQLPFSREVELLLSKAFWIGKDISEAASPPH